jgi:hypothetical protein
MGAACARIEKSISSAARLVIKIQLVCGCHIRELSASCSLRDLYNNELLSHCPAFLLVTDVCNIINMRKSDMRSLIAIRLPFAVVCVLVIIIE